MGTVSEMMSNTTATLPPMEAPSDLTFTRRITYIVLQTGQLFSFFAYLFVGYHLLSSPRNLRITLGTHVIVVLLLLNFVQLTLDMPLALQYLKTSVVRPSADIVCNTWMFFDSFTYYLSLLLMAWASFERHLLIFHSHLLNTRRRRIYLHYAPILGLFLYALIYYVFVDYFYPCVNTFDFSIAFCGYVCYMALSKPTLFGIEMMAHQVVPTILITMFSGGLLMRTCLSRHRLQRSVEWRKYRKMITQLASVSLMYLVFSVPFSLNPIAQLAGKPTPFGSDVALNIFSYWAYGISIFLPFVVAMSLPNLGEKLKRLIVIRRSRRVMNVTNTPSMHPAVSAARAERHG